MDVETTNGETVMENIVTATRVPKVEGAGATVTPKPKLLDQLREALRSRHYSRRT